MKSIPSGNLLHSELENDHRNSGFTHKKMVMFHSYVSLPEGNGNNIAAGWWF